MRSKVSKKILSVLLIIVLVAGNSQLQGFAMNQEPSAETEVLNTDEAQVNVAKSQQLSLEKDGIEEKQIPEVDSELEINNKKQRNNDTTAVVEGVPDAKSEVEKNARDDQSVVAQEQWGQENTFSGETFAETVPTSFPQYYTTSEVNGQTVYGFLGRDNAFYYRIHGTIDGENEGFYSCDQYGENLAETAIVDLTDEYNTIAPLAYESVVVTDMPNEGYTLDPVLSEAMGYEVYTYPDVDGGTQYRVYGQAVNVSNPDDTLGWYYADENGKVVTNKEIIEDIDKDSDNLWAQGFKEETPSTVPDFYGIGSAQTGPNSIHNREKVWAYTDRNGNSQYRVYGSVNGAAPAFYECDQYGNVGHPIQEVNMEDEEKNLKPTENQKGKELVPDEALVIASTISQVYDGTADFDADNNPGNDENNQNKIVRSFDTISYILTYTTGMQADSSYLSFEEGDLHVEFVLPMEKDRAVFDIDAMNWLVPGFTIVEEDGKQILRGIRRLDKGVSSVAIPGSGSLSVVVKVLGAANGDVVKPTFTLWLDGNERDPEHESHEAKRVVGDEVKVSAAPKYNVQLKRNTVLSYKSTFDLDSGQEATASSTNKVSGRMYGFGVTLQLYNDTVSKGMKGIEIPQGPISFTLEMKMEASTGGVKTDITDEFTPILWDYKVNDMSNIGNKKFRMYWLNTYSRHAAYAAPRDNAGIKNNLGNSVFNSGAYTATQTGNLIHITVDKYAFGDYEYPTNNYGDSVGVAAKRYLENVGCFSAGYVQLIAEIPSTVEESTNYNLIISDKDLNATSKSGIKITGEDPQMKLDDDQVSVQIPKNPVGAFSRRNWVTKKNSASFYPEQGGLYSSVHSGDAWTTPGSEIELWGGYSVEPSNDSELWAYDVNILQKFDDEAFEIPAGSSGSYSTVFHEGIVENFSYTLLYAAKPDGSGWASDSEMDAAMEEDLVYYGSIDALNAAGKTCVAVLIEGRDGLAAAGMKDNIGFNVKVRDTVEIGKVYQLTNEVRIWNEQNQLSEGQTRLESSAVYPDFISVYRSYVKSEYDESGQIKTGTHSATYQGGQSVLMVGFQSYIEKGIAQKSGDDQKKVYDLEAGQRRVDYVLTPTIKTEKGNSVGTMTTVTITDILPKGLSYQSGSSYLGGTYVTDTTVYGGHVEGGASLEPTITIVKDKNNDDVEQLVWVLSDVEVDQVLDQVFFSCIIGNTSDPDQDVKNGENFSNYVRIQAEGDNRAINDTNKNQSTAGMSVVLLTSTKPFKSVEKPMNEIGDDIVYTITYSNSASNPLTNMKLLDILPYIGDGRGTKYDGSYWIENIEVDRTKAPTSNLEVLSTQDTTVRDKKASTAGISTWSSAPLLSSASGIDTFSISNASDKITPTAIGVQGTLGAQETIVVKISLKVVENKPGNIYGNDASAFGDGIPSDIPISIVQAKVVRRTVEGITWIDSNRNGKREKGEKLLSGVKVVLRDSTGTEVTHDILGNAFGTVLTDSNGAYQFTNLPAGDYQVTFETSSLIDLSNYHLTTQRATGVSTALNSDADQVLNDDGKLKYAIIEGLTTPNLEEMKLYDFRLSNQDAGFYGEVIFTKTANPQGGTVDEQGNPVDPVSVDEGQVIIYTIEVDSLQAPISKVIITDKIPEGLSFVQGSISYQLAGGSVVKVSDSAYNKSTHTIVWPELNLPQGKTKVTFKAVVDKLPEGTDYRSFANFATMVERGNDYEYPPTETVTHQVINRKAEIHKTAAEVVYDENQEEVDPLVEDNGTASTPVETQRRQMIEYRLLVKNTGYEDSLSDDIIVTDPIPAGTIYVPDSMTFEFRDSDNPAAPITGSAATAVMSDGSIIKPDGTTIDGVKWILNSMKPGEEAYLTFRVTAPITTDDITTPEYETEAVFTNTANLFDKELSKKVYEESFTDKGGNKHKKGDKVYPESEYNMDSNTTYHKVREPLVSAVKSSIPAVNSDGSIPVVKEGDVITYTITLTNSGSTAAKEVKVRDYIPEYTSYVEDSVDNEGVLSQIDKEVDGTTISKERLDWIIPEIQVGETVSVSFQVTVNGLESEEGALLIKNTGLYQVPDETLPKNPVDPEDPENPGTPEQPDEPDTEFNKTNEVVHQVSSFIKYADPMGGSNEEDAVFVKQGQAITYTLQLNAEEAINGITVSDQIPQGLGFVYGSIKYINPDGSEVSVPDSAYKEETRTITWPTINAKIGITRFQFQVGVEKLPEDVYAKAYSNKAILEYSDPEKEPVETNTVTHKTNTGKTEIDKTATTILVDKNGLESIDKEGAGSTDKPIQTELGQIVEYKLTVKRTADEENRSKKIVVKDILPEGTSFINGSINGKFTVLGKDSTATIESMEFKMIKDKDGKEKPGVEWVLDGLSDTETAELTFRVFAPETTDNPETPEYETNKQFRNTASLEDLGQKELVYEVPLKDHSQGENLLPETVYLKESPTTYHEVKSPLPEVLPIKDKDPQEEARDDKGYTNTNGVKHKQVVGRKMTGLPKTGDETQIMAMISLVMISFGSIIAYVLVERRKKRQINKM